MCKILTDLQKKDDLRRELRLLVAVYEIFTDDQFMDTSKDFFVKRLVQERIEDIQKALED